MFWIVVNEEFVVSGVINLHCLTSGRGSRDGISPATRTAAFDAEDPQEFLSEILVEPPVKHRIEASRAEGDQMADGKDETLAVDKEEPALSHVSQDVDDVERHPAGGEHDGNEDQETVGSTLPRFLEDSFLGLDRR